MVGGADNQSLGKESSWRCCGNTSGEIIADYCEVYGTRTMCLHLTPDMTRDLGLRVSRFRTFKAGGVHAPAFGGGGVLGSMVELGTT